VAVDHHGVVQQRGQAGLDLALVEGQRQRLGHRGDHLHDQLAQLHAARRLGLGHYQALHRQHGLRASAGRQQPSQLRLDLADSLYRAPAIAHDQEGHAAQPAARVQPALHPHALAEMFFDLDCGCSLHDCLQGSNS
jgi:hypothetical protein